MLYDIIIVGGGPAGLTAAIYARRAEKSVLVLEAAAFGGQIFYTDNIENYPGISSVSGADFADALYAQAKSCGADMKIESVSAVKDGKVKTVISSKGECVTGAFSKTAMCALSAEGTPPCVTRFTCHQYAKRSILSTAVPSSAVKGCLCHSLKRSRMWYSSLTQPCSG